MSKIERVLLIINRAAGPGHTDALVHRLRAILAGSLESGVSLHAEAVGNHATARERASQFLRESNAPAYIIAGGGGGTLRAVIEGACESSKEVGRLPSKERVLLSTLRMGSGNLLAKEFGVPRDPEEGLRGLLANLKAGVTVPCCLMRCETETSGPGPMIHYAASLAGFGQFGRTPGDLARWHAIVAPFRRLAARIVALESLTELEYAVALLLRSASCALFPQLVETVEINFDGRSETMRLLAGVALNFPVRALPFGPGVRAPDEALSIHLLPYAGRLSPFLQLLDQQSLARRARHIRLERGARLEMRFAGTRPTEFFLDEDPIVARGRVALEVAGTLAFVPGPLLCANR